MKVNWNALPRKAWNEFHAQNGGSLQQSWAYGEAMLAMGVQVHRAAVLSQGGAEGEGKVIALAQFIGRRYAAYLSLATCTRGPVWSVATPSTDQALAYKLLRQSLPMRSVRVALFSPDQSLVQLPANSVKGMHRVMSGYSTVLLDLTQSEAQLREKMDGKWRNRLVKAEVQAGIHVQLGAHRRACDKLLEREKAQRLAKNFHGLPTAFVPAYLDAQDKASPGFLLASAQYRGDLVAGMLFLLHGAGATYYMGWSDPQGRKLSVHNRMLWQALLELKKNNIQSLDLGGINTHDLPGISRFKLGTGGQVLTLAGTYF